MTDDELRAIAERAERAPPGPWELWTGCSWRRFGVAGTLQRVLEPTTDPFDGHPDLIMADGVGDFVAHAREDIPVLLAALAHEREARAADRDGAAEAWKRLDAAYQQERARADEVRRSNAALVGELDSARERVEELRRLLETGWPGVTLSDEDRRRWLDTRAGTARTKVRPDADA